MQGVVLLSVQELLRISLFSVHVWSMFLNVCQLFANTATLYPLKMYSIFANVGACHTKRKLTKFGSQILHLNLYF